MNTAMDTYRSMWHKYREAIATGNPTTYEEAYNLAELVIKQDCPHVPVGESVTILANRR